MSLARIHDCEDFTGVDCTDEEAPPLPEAWALVGAAVGVVYRDDQGQNWMHKLEGELLAAPGFLLIEEPGLKLDAIGLVGSDEI